MFSAIHAQCIPYYFYNTIAAFHTCRFRYGISTELAEGWEPIATLINKAADSCREQQFPPPGEAHAAFCTTYDEYQSYAAHIQATCCDCTATATVLESAQGPAECMYECIDGLPVSSPLAWRF